MKKPVRAKKHLGQHFLRVEAVAEKMIEAVKEMPEVALIEVGPGDGVLSKYLLKMREDVQLLDVDTESIQYLKEAYSMHRDQVIEQDFLHFPIAKPTIVVGNFPYNISSQIVFHILDYKEHVPGMVGMFQKEVAERLAVDAGSKTYGILSVLAQAYYEIEYLFTVEPEAFEPPPKVQSGVVRMQRRDPINLECDQAAFTMVVKRAFNQRRKMIRKSLRDLVSNCDDPALERFLTKRPEQLSVADFVELTQLIAPVK